MYLQNTMVVEFVYHSYILIISTILLTPNTSRWETARNSPLGGMPIAHTNNLTPPSIMTSISSSSLPLL